MLSVAVLSDAIASQQAAPVFDVTTAAPSVMVATSEPGESYAEPEECMRKDIICMRYPIWFRANPIQSVYGVPPKLPIVVTTYTHYGQPEPDDENSPRIMLLLESTGRFMMPVYASGRVWRRSDDQYYILIDTPYPIHWLPCSVEDLREPIDARRFSTKARLALDDYSVKEHPELFLLSRGYATPQFGISVARLSEHLRRLQPSSTDFSCVRDDES